MRANSIREAIQGFFDSRHCFLFYFPVDQLQNLEMDSKFCEVGDQFVLVILVETYLATIKGGAYQAWRLCSGLHGYL